MNTVQQAGQSARDLAQKIAKQMAQEPLEVLKTASQQVTGSEQVTNHQEVGPLNNQKTLHQQNELHDKAKSSRRMEALNQELKDIRKQDLFKDLQEKISQGVDVPIADYTELSMEQRQVLNAQMEAFKIQNAKFKSQNLVEVPAVHSKPSRRFGAGQKQEAEKQQTHVEKPVPPSG